MGVDEGLVPIGVGRRMFWKGGIVFDEEKFLLVVGELVELHSSLHFLIKIPFHGVSARFDQQSHLVNHSSWVKVAGRGVVLPDFECLDG